MNNIRIRLRQILTGEKRNDTAAKIFNSFIIVLIILNIITFIMQTEQEFDKHFGRWLYYFEFFSVMVFTVEYLCRLISCSVNRHYVGFKGFIRFVFSPMALVDLLAIAPFYLPFLGIDLRIVRVLRLFRVFRIFKISRYTSSLNMIKNVFIKCKEELIISSAIMFVLLLLSSTLMYYAEKEAQPDKFSSIPSAMWWAVITLTTVGYGDVYPITTVGRIICALAAITGIGFFALPISILGSGFIEEINAKKKGAKCPHCGEKL